MAFKFEKLKVWQKSLVLATDIHYMTRDWPKEEVFSLISQIKRASDSITLNIAEGSTGNTTPEFKRFLTMANRSAIEVVSCLYLAKNRNYIDNTIFDKFYNDLNSLIRMIQALKTSLK